MSMGPYKGRCYTCGHDHDNDTMLVAIASYSSYRDSVIEECAKVCDVMAEQYEDQQQFALDLCSDAIRDLKEGAK